MKPDPTAGADAGDLDRMVDIAIAEQTLISLNQVLRPLAEGQPLPVVLTALCRILEAMMPGASCSILLLDETGERLRHAAAPSLPASFAAAIDGARIGPAAGSCGTAAYLGQPVITEDVDADPRWIDWRELARDHGVRACWSVPILDREQDRVLGTFALYYREPRAPLPTEFSLVAQSSELAGVAIIHARDRAALVAAKEAAEEANQAKSAFLAMANHELRTPLQAVLGYTEFLLADPQATLTTEQREDLRFIQQGGQRMLGLINQMLDLARLEAGGLVLHPKPVDLTAILEQVRQDAAPQASQKGVQLRLTLPTTLPAILADAERLRQILLNLVGNAVKFTDQGMVTVSAQSAADQVTIAVKDTGIGIAPEELPHIFEAFRQVESRRARRYGGAGLGLAIAQKLTDLMDGQIAVESEPGVGSTFTLHLPVAPPRQEDASLRP